MKCMCFFLVFVFLFFVWTAPIFGEENEISYLPLPILARTAGIGVYYGPGFLVQNLYSSIDVGAVKLWGRVDAEAFLVGEIPLFFDNFTLGVAQGKVNRLYLDISYTRGMEKDSPVTQVSEGEGRAYFLNLSLLEKSLLFSVMHSTGTLRFNGYQDQNEKKIPMPDLYLGDLSAGLTNFSLTYHRLDNPIQPREGGQIGINLSSFTNTTSLSETQNLEYFLGWYFPLLEQSTLHLYAFASDATVTRQAVTDLTKIQNTLHVDCDQLTDSTEKETCEKISLELAQYIQAHNQYGTARPLGGSRMLRSYRESRFRGAHSRFAGSEFRWQYPNFFSDVTLQIALFAETGSVTDDPGALGSEQRHSYGTGTRLILGQAVVRLDLATGEEGEEYHLTIGNSW